MLGQAIAEFIEDRRKERITATEKKVQKKATLLFKELYPDVQHEFSASRGWFRPMCRRNNLVYRRVTSVGQKVPKNAAEIAERFLEDMKNIGEFANVVDMDETPCYFGIPRPSNIDKKGVQTVKVMTTDAERLRFTVASTPGVEKAENGLNPFRLPPLLIFKTLVKAPPGKYPARMAVLSSKNGTMKYSMKKETYVKRIWKRRPYGFFNTGKSILLMDSAKSHLGDEVEQA